MSLLTNLVNVIQDDPRYTELYETQQADSSVKAIHIAAALGSTELIQQAISMDSDTVSDTDSQGRTPIMYALYFGANAENMSALRGTEAPSYLGAIYYLLNKGASATTTDAYGNYVAHYVGYYGDVDLLEYLEANYSLEATKTNATSGETVLHAAAYNPNNGPMIDILVNKYSLGINAKTTTTSYQPLDIALGAYAFEKHGDFLQQAVADSTTITDFASNLIDDLYTIEDSSTISTLISLGGTISVSASSLATMLIDNTTGDLHEQEIFYMEDKTSEDYYPSVSDEYYEGAAAGLPSDLFDLA